MRFKVGLLFLLLAVFLLCGGCVICTAPVGDKVVVLDPKLWNAKWQGGDGGIVRTKIKDAKLGVIEMTANSMLVSDISGKKKQQVLIRNLGPLLIANENAGDSHNSGYEFARIDIDATHLVTFGADKSVFASLVRRHEIAGKLDRDEHGKPNGDVILNGFSDKDYQRLKREGFDVRSLFDENPSTVLIRYHWNLFW